MSIKYKSFFDILPSRIKINNLYYYFSMIKFRASSFCDQYCLRYRLDRDIEIQQGLEDSFYYNFQGFDLEELIEKMICALKEDGYI